MSTTFFGVGAQKAGTTWLYDLLERYPDCAPTPVKEMHFFDAKYVGSMNGAAFVGEFEDISARATQLAGRMAKLREKGIFKDIDYGEDPLAGKGVDETLDRIIRNAQRLKVRDSASYVAYMEEWRRTSGAKAVGEITPAYSILPEAGFEEMNRLYPESKFIFIMRDPVDRFWSQVRFFMMKRGKSVDPNAMIGRMLKREEFQLRSDYVRTVRTMESVIDPSRIFYCFFESLVAPETTVDEVRKLEAFLGLEPLPETFLTASAARPSNSSPAAKMSEASRGTLRAAFAPVYDFVAERWPDRPDRWRVGT